MKILLTNIWLVNPAGTEVVIRDLALGLQRRGHRPIVYSPMLGPFAELLSAKGVAVIDDLRKLAEPPDIIHAHHSIPCGEAIIRFPAVPAVFVCHAFIDWMEAPVHFPQIGAYVAVDEACRDRLVHSEGIAPEKVVVLRNAVDLRRIPPRPHGLARRPLRACAFGKAAALPEVRTACENLGIAFSVIGAPDVPRNETPEQELVGVDLVFATGRSAIEAMCCGCAVIVCDQRGFSGLVTSDNFDALRAYNFGLRSLVDPVTVDLCLKDIARYDSVDAGAVSERARREADLETLLDQYETLYAEVLNGARRPSLTEEARQSAVSRFMHENLPRRPADARWPWLPLHDRMTQDLDALQDSRREAFERGEAAERREARVLQSLQDLQQAKEAADRRMDALSRELAAHAEVARALAIRAEAAEGRAAAAENTVRRSRLLKLGRLLRRLAGRDRPY